MRQISTLANKAFSTRKESSLHSAIKKWYFQEGDRLEARVDDFIVDIVRGALLIEIQTANFSAIKPKFSQLLVTHKIRLVYPIAVQKWIVRKSTTTGEAFCRRRSPKRGCVLDVFDELIRIPSLFSNGNLSIEVLMIEMEEIWCNDGKGSWRRRGASIEDKKLIRVLGRMVFENKADFLQVLPKNLTDPFSNRNLAESLGITVNRSRRMTYALRKIGVITHVGNDGRQMLFGRAKLSLCANQK
jgi:hypothetical protein